MEKTYCLHPFPWSSSGAGFACQACGHGPLTLPGPGKNIQIARVDVHCDDPDRYAFGIAEAFTKRITGQMGIPKNFGPLAIPIPHGPITVKIDATLGPGEIRIEQVQPRSCVCGDPKCGQPADAPPMLIDGLTPDECLERWLENRRRQERKERVRGQAGGLIELTAAQIAAAKALWPESLGALASTELRAKVEASAKSDAARKPSVVVDLEEP